jgi:glyoxylase-like metal-dependent hydrolase (beta-lactamase superfamily II)
MTSPRQLAPNLHYLRLSVGQAYLWIADDDVTLIDTGGPGSLPEIQAAFRQLEIGADDLRRIVLTHGHGSSAGATAEVVHWAGGVEVIAHRNDAPIVRGAESLPRPRLHGPGTWLSNELIAALAAYPAAPVHREVSDLNVVDFGGGAVIRHTPGHTPGSIAIHLPKHRVVFTGGAATRTRRGITLGHANADDDAALFSFARIAQLKPDIACFGFGPPVVGDAAGKLLTAFFALDAARDHSSEPRPETRYCEW